LAYFSFSFRIERGKYPPVFAEDIVNGTYKIGRIAIQAVVVTTAAISGTEFFICPTIKCVTAF